MFALVITGPPGAGKTDVLTALGDLLVADDIRHVSDGHRHPGQEEVYFVISGTVTFKIDNDVFETRPRTAVRIGGGRRTLHRLRVQD